MIPQCKQNKPAYCKAHMTEDYIIQATNTTEILPLGTFESVGGNLTLTADGGVKIGKGIKVIQVCASVYFHSPITVNAEKIIYITKGNSSKAVNNTRITDTLEHVQAATVFEVAENDIIYLKVNGTENDKIASYGSGTYLTITKIA